MSIAVLTLSVHDISTSIIWLFLRLLPGKEKDPGSAAREVVRSKKATATGINSFNKTASCEGVKIKAARLGG